MTSPWAALRLRSGTFYALMITALLWSQITLAVPTGTVINNTVIVNFDAHGGPMPPESATESFAVVDLGSADSADLVVTTAPATENVFAGSSTTLNIDITNTSFNLLGSGELHITALLNTTIGLTGNGVNPVATSSTATTTTRVFSITDIASTVSENFVATLTLPISLDPNNNGVVVNYYANGNSVNSKNATLNLNNRTRATLELLQYSYGNGAQTDVIKSTDYKQSDNTFSTITAPEVPGTAGTLVTDGPIPLEAATEFSHDQTIFVRVTDYDHNTDDTIAETIEVTLSVSDSGESETLRLTETTVNSGTFTGHVKLAMNPATANDGLLDVHANSSILASYIDDIDPADISTSNIIVDPYGKVLDGATGAGLNGYTVHFINTDTGQPATVYGDDGVSIYPATMITGATVTDSSNKVYNYGDGEYRFPFAPPGNYQLVVVPPTGALYRFPSSRETLQLINLPGGPYAITLGSRGEHFRLLPGPPLHIDLPVDPLTHQMYVQRTASKTNVGPGDFIQFRVSLENVANATLNNVLLNDILPHGLRIEQGSVLIDGVAASNAILSNDGSAITFDLGTMAATDSHIIEYVAAVGAVRMGQVSSNSHATANSGAADSNTATVYTTITEELMRSRSILMGRVAIKPTGDDSDKLTDHLEGVRIYMEDGRYAITDERGMYHFENIVPGQHVVQIDQTTVPVRYQISLAENNTRFAGYGWSQFVDIQGGTLWRTDFYLSEKPAPKGKMSLKINYEPGIYDTIKYHVSLLSDSVPLDNMRLTVLIPEQAKYVPGSSASNGTQINDPSITDNMLVYRLSDDDGHWNSDISFAITDIKRADSAELITKALAMFDSPAKKGQRSPIVSSAIQAPGNGIREITEEFIIIPRFELGSADLSPESQEELNKIVNELAERHNLRLHITGHTDSIPFGSDSGNDRYSNNQELSEYRAQVVAGLLQKILNLPADQITSEGMSYYEPIADNSTEKGRIANRRVHILALSGGQDKDDDTLVPVIDPESYVDHASIDTDGSFSVMNITKQSDIADTKPSEVYDINWLNNQTDSIEWVHQNELPAIPSTKVVIKHNLEQSVALSLNGEPVPAVNFEGMMRSNSGAAISIWLGVDLIEGDNLFEAVIHNKEGNEIQRINRLVHFSGPPVEAELLGAQSRLIADGITNPVIAIRLTDKYGYPARLGLGGQFEINPPYRPMRSDDFSTENMPGASSPIHNYQVGADGIALITLEPTPHSGDVEIKLPLAFGKDTQITAQLKAAPREWILVGLAESTIGDNDLNGNLTPLSGDAADSGVYQDGRIALFAKGQVLGKWLLTIAYDTDKERPTSTDPNMFQAIDPGTYYTIYGDSSQNGYDAASSEKLYLKLERDEFFLLYGDYETNLNKTKLGKYNRTLTGLKSRYQDERYDVVVFGSESNQAFVKDEFRGQGISGPYQLSRSNIALNSDRIIIESRNRFRSEEVTESRQLSRHTDYDIDYLNGTITFRMPVFSIDRDLNPVHIIAEYESFDEDDVATTYGGRGEIKVDADLTVGISHINEGLTGGNGQLDGVDVAYAVSENATVKFEAAHSSKSNDLSSNASGSAYLAEIEHQSGNTAAKAYLSEQDQEFGLGQTNGAENGMRKAGAEASVLAADNMTIKGQTYRHENTITDATRDVAEAEAQTTIVSTNLRLGVRGARDQRGDGSKQHSNQMIAGASKTMLNNKLTMHLDREQNLSNDNSIDFPNRTLAGADVRLTEKTSAFIEHEFADGNVRDTRNTLVGIKSSPTNTSEVYTGIKQSQGDNGSSTSAQFAGTQNWLLSDDWSLKFGAENSRTLSSSPGTPLNSNIPFASGSSEDFTATSLGATYSPGNLLWTSRIENRIADNEDRLMLATSIQTSPNSDLSLLAGLSLQQSEQVIGTKQNNINISLGLAYRPEDTRWIILDKLEFKWHEKQDSDFNNEGMRIINNLNINYKQDRWQHSLQYGAKNVKETISNLNYSSYVDLTGFESRYDINSNWDVGLHGSVLHAWKLDHFDYSSGVSVGHSVANNIWLSLGYNFTGFHDSDFSSSRYTNRGVYFKFRLKFDQASVKEAIKWANN